MHRFSDLFLTSSGRIGRIAFILGGGVLLALWAGFDLLAPLKARDLVGWLVAAALLYGGACVLSQRLHDRGRSGWWSGPILLAVAMAWPRPQAPLDWIAAAVLILAIIDLTLAPGQKAFNRYGAPPKGQSGASPS
ncbi:MULTISPECIES: DUF805 domain-containing protein [unclassified Brevundimonas]|uniref:DUF805 domain-containing protein n=1 Tax=unclassified Brevundimonas TaxID=2622653 RepID=UPI000CFD42D8|nr:MULTISPECIES: DUF805 domain-containing protein [unclassified Brevundimonas]PRA26894.1 DUF805 domain-containing protein [Brevundimonas sp. MYb27]PQZ76951.1 DUF805 domain-containing protein [Brevundimonas sp. MYb31]PRB11855.1 DUF805 domain-containing protein [Brevundimonas sp. MYb52]PRB32839.1 DUF805 domain-containing protein [Brevundimonas sp. MYb46]PRB47282.1 DUF805 domain-containing protein [Brevundimonas sp. MYb33]